MFALEMDAESEGNKRETATAAEAATRRSQGIRPEHWPTINMDCMAYGMGCCCLQITFLARDLKESRYLYDQLAVLTPIFLALTAAAPVFHGRCV